MHRGALPLAYCALALAAASGCRARGERDGVERPSPTERAAIADTLRALVARAYDFSKPGVVDRLMTLYAPADTVVSASVGRVTASRDSLRSQIAAFWNETGHYMQHPRWEWGPTRVDVLSRDAAVLTGSYRIPHHTPRGDEHVIGGAMTLVFVRRSGQWVILHEHLSDVPATQ